MTTPGRLKGFSVYRSPIIADLPARASFDAGSVKKRGQAFYFVVPSFLQSPFLLFRLKGGCCVNPVSGNPLSVSMGVHVRVLVREAGFVNREAFPAARNRLFLRGFGALGIDYGWMNDD